MGDERRYGDPDLGRLAAPMPSAAAVPGLSATPRGKRQLSGSSTAALLLDEPRARFTPQPLTKASDAHDVRVESTKLEDHDLDSQG
jgi:hypothetical protein